MKLILIFVAIVYFVNLPAQANYNSTLKKELDSLYVLDQKYRNVLFITNFQEKRDSLASVFDIPVDNLQDSLIKLMMRADSSNIKRIDEIIAQYGYPGKTRVGTPTNESTWYIIQHSPKIDTYLPIIKKAAQKKELPYELYAKMLDRSLMQNGKEQVYGTQGKGFLAKNAQTGKEEWTMIIWPIKNSATVNKRRKKAGFEQTIEENANRMGIKYKPLTLFEVNKMQAQ
jgi:hypothetical protein